MAALAAASAFGGAKKSDEKKNVKKIPQTVTAIAAKEDVEFKRSYLISLIPYAQTNALSKAAGYVAAIYADVGDRVKKGQRLATVESEEQRQSLERVEILAAKNFVSQAELDAAKNAFKSASAQLQYARDARKLAVTKASYAEITSPMDGYVISRGVDIGALVGTSGPALFSIGNLDKVKGIASVPQPDAPYMKIGKEAVMLLNGIEDKPIKGKIARIAPALDPLTRKLDIEIRFEEAGENFLKAGMFGRVEIVVEKAAGIIALDPLSILRRADGIFVYAVENGKAKEIKITLGRTLNDGRFEVLSGVAEGMEIITVGRDLVKDGAEVKTVKPAR
jgi:RND family efflux transporter MFP subunit